MINVLGENYYIDIDEIEKYIDMSDTLSFDEMSLTGGSEMRVNIIKYELIKMFLDVILSEDLEIDDKLGLKSSSNNISVPFKIAFNSLLYKNIINHY